MPSPKPSPLLRGLFGLLLLLPACGLCTVDQLWLTLSTFTSSLKDMRLNMDGEFIGFKNYIAMFTDQLFPASLGYTTLLIVIHLLAAAILPPLLAMAVHRFSKRGSRLARLWFTLPLAYFGPAMAMFAPAFLRDIWKPDSLHRTYLLLDGVVALAVACGIGLVVYLAVLRGQKEDGKLPTGTLFTTWLVTQLAMIAYGLQSFNLLALITPGRGGKFVLGQMLAQTVRNSFLGLTSSISVFLILLAALFGIIATVVLIARKIQISHHSEDASASPQPSSGFFIPGMVALVLGGLAAFFVTIVPLGMGLVNAFGNFSSVEFGPFLRTAANTVLPSLLTVLFIQLPVAYLGALGISVVRPFGKGSMWLLLLFSPWLFVTSMPLALAAFKNLRAVELLDSPLALTPPLLLNIPLLFILTLFFKGQYQTWQATGKEGTPSMGEVFTHWVRPSLPLALFMAVLSVLVTTQDVFASYLVGISREQQTITIAIAQIAGTFNPGSIAAILALFGIPFFILTFIILAILQVTYLDRLRITNEV